MIAALAISLAIVSTKPSAAPVTIESCKFVQSASFSRGVRIVYKNTSKTAARLVIFDVVQGKHTTEVIDEGAFAPGETVDHVLTSAPLTLWMGENPNGCAVVHVHFVDGTTWSK